jgi:urea carboxylase
MGARRAPLSNPHPAHPATAAPPALQVRSAFTASVWDIKVAVGDKVAAEDTLVVLEAMKMESPVVAPCSGTVKAVRVAQGQLAPAGTLLVVIEKDA